MNKMKNGANDKDIEEGSIERIGKERILRKDKKKADRRLPRKDETNDLKLQFEVKIRERGVQVQ